MGDVRHSNSALTDTHESEVFRSDDGEAIW